MAKIEDYLTSEMPIERLFAAGPEALAEAELLSLILSTGSSEEDVIKLSNRLIKEFRGLHAMAKADAKEFLNIKGIGKSKAARLAATFQIAKILSGARSEPNFSLTSPNLIFDYVRKKLCFEDREHFLVLALNSRYEIIHEHVVSIGTEVKTFAEPREVFKMAVRLGASYIAVCHNHPSGHNRPSEEDIKLTKRLVDAGNLLGIKLVDHLIIGYNNYYSMKEEGDI